jgi:medium-chain acyl-CoA synthetase
VLTSEASASASSAGQAASLVKELQDFCKNHAAPYKYPRKVEFVDATFLPKTISGKIKRGDLKKLERQRYQEENHNNNHFMSKL